jgi:hypothetical protein
MGSNEAMRVLKMKRSAFYAYVKQGIIPAVRIKHFIRIRREIEHARHRQTGVIMAPKGMVMAAVIFHMPYLWNLMFLQENL